MLEAEGTRTTTRGRLMAINLITAIAIVGMMLMLYIVTSALRSHGIGPALVGVGLFSGPVAVITLLLEVTQ